MKNPRYSKFTFQYGSTSIEMVLKKAVKRIDLHSNMVLLQ